MIKVLLVPVWTISCLHAQGSADSASSIDKRLSELLKAKDWGSIADLMETLTAKERERRGDTWILALNKAGRWERLVQACDEVLPQIEASAGPRFGVERAMRAQALSRLNRHEEALDAHRTNGGLGSLAGYRNACVEARLLGNWKALQECAEAVLAKEPTNGECLAMKGESLARQARYPEAEPVLLEASHLVPGRAMTWADLACCLNERGAYQEALRAADQALQIDPRLMEGLCNHGRACFGLKRYRDGRKDFAAALALGPADPALVQNLKLNVKMADRYLAETKR